MTDRAFTDRDPARSIWRWAVALAAAGFGIATVLAGGHVLLGGESARAAGAYVPFVVAFNFAAGFAYVAAAAGLALRRAWTARLAAAIAGATLLVFAAFGVHVATGGAFEGRTIGAMTLRSMFWIAFAVAASRLVPRRGQRRQA
jgi:hypothetical protein